MTGNDGATSLLLVVDVGHFAELVNRVPGTIQLNFPVCIGAHVYVTVVGKI